MEKKSTEVDGFLFIPPKLAAWIKSHIPETPFTGEIPFVEPAKPLEEMRIALVTSAGISLKSDTPFDMSRELEEPEYGDPTYRVIPRGTGTSEIDVNHLHINTDLVKEDMNSILPLDRMAELEEEELIGELAPSAYSFYGFQMKNDDFLEQAIAPMTEKMVAEGVDGALLTPA